jgi:hypothetical protein
MKELKRYADKYGYDFNIQIMDGDFNIFVNRGGTDLFSTGGHKTFSEAKTEVIKWIKRVNP